MTGIDWDTPPPPGYWRNARGDLIREANVSEIDRDMDATTRHIHAFGGALSAEMFRFRTHTQDDVYALIDRVAERYGAKLGGRKGNVQIGSFDGRMRVTISQADVIDVGPEIHAAQAIVEECLDEWTERGNLKLRALIDQAFRPDATGHLSVAHLLRLRRIAIDDDRWRAVQAAIGDALRPVGRAEYIRLHRRDDPAQRWEQVPLHLATVRAPLVQDDDPAAQLARRIQSAVEQAGRAGMAPGDVWDVVRAAIARAAPGAAAACRPRAGQRRGRTGRPGLNSSNHWLLPIRQRWAEMILDGSKTCEIRRVRRHWYAGDWLWLYAIAPVQAVVGVVVVSAVRTGPAGAMYRAAGGRAALRTRVLALRAASG